MLFITVYISSYKSYSQTILSDNVMTPPLLSCVIALLGIIAVFHISIYICTTRYLHIMKELVLSIGRNTIPIMALHFALYRVICYLGVPFLINHVALWISLFFCVYLFKNKYLKYLTGR